MIPSIQSIHIFIIILIFFYSLTFFSSSIHSPLLHMQSPPSIITYWKWCVIAYNKFIVKNFTIKFFYDKNLNWEKEKGKNKLNVIRYECLLLVICPNFRLHYNFTNHLTFNGPLKFFLFVTYIFIFFFFWEYIYFIDERR